MSNEVLNGSCLCGAEFCGGFTSRDILGLRYELPDTPKMGDPSPLKPPGLCRRAMPDPNGSESRSVMRPAERRCLSVRGGCGR